MKLRECLIVAAQFAGLYDEYDLLTEGKTVFGHSARTIKILTDAANMVIKEIAEAYLPLRTTETIETDGEGCVYYNRLTKVPAYFFGVKKDASSLKFKEFPTCLRTGKGEVTLEYAYMPDTVLLDGDIPFADGCPGKRIIGYGIAAEYFLMTEQPDAAMVWDKRFRDALHIAAHKRGKGFIRAREWV